VPPEDYPQLAAELQARMPRMAAGQRRIAQLVLSDPEATAFRSIGETARAAQVHESSLVRFATGLGLSGYPALVRLCRQRLADQAHLVRRFERAEEVGEQDLLATVAEHDRDNIARSVATLDRAAWDRVVTLLATAPAVHILGLRKCFTVAYLLAYLLRMVRRGIGQLGTPAGLPVDELRDLASGEVFVAVSIHRYTADTVRALAHAKRSGLATVALTDNPASPLVPHADVVLYLAADGVTVFRSLTAFVSVAQGLATAVAVRSGTSSRDQLDRDERLLAEFGVYQED
jgi:DNA-binding MurR/RpiR family transcriptional regulator